MMNVIVAKVSEINQLTSQLDSDNQEQLIPKINQARQELAQISIEFYQTYRLSKPSNPDT